MGDEYVSSEHLLLALAESGGTAKEMLATGGADRRGIERAIREIREASGVQNVTEPGGESNLESLKKYGIDLTERAQAGKLDPVIGRDEEIRRCMQVLGRRTKNNPVLIGEPGVGKTAIAEGLALHRQRRLPDSMKDRRIICAGRRAAAGRRQVPRRVRGAAQAEKRGHHSGVRSSCSSTSCTRSSRGLDSA
jgi:ATP-dependent Clp protease ATP-binding subunit ClpB